MLLISCLVGIFSIQECYDKIIQKYVKKILTTQSKGLCDRMI
jgi:hypothetical protein